MVRNIKNILYLTPLLVGLVSCNLFKLPEPPEPSPGGEDWLFPDSPANVMQNFVNSVNSFNISLYLRCFERNEFMFYPEDRLVNGPSGDLYRDWTFEVESTRVSTLFNSLDMGHIPSPIVFNLEYTVIDSIENLVRVRANYDLTVYLSESPGSAHAVGESQFTLKRDQANLWAITEWYDLADSGYLSFAEIKARDF